MASPDLASPLRWPPPILGAGRARLLGLLQVGSEATSPPTRLGWKQCAPTVGLGIVLLAYANGDAWFATRRPQSILPPVNLRHLGMLLLSLGWAGSERLPRREMGLTRQGMWPSLGWGLLVGTLGSIPVWLFFSLPLAVSGVALNRAVTQPELSPLSRGQMLTMLVGQVLLSTAVFEEVAFRGVLHAKLVRLLGIRRALLVGSGLFAGWHAVIAWANLRRCALPRVLRAPLYGGAMVLMFLAGLLFGVLRQGTGHVAGGIVAHWLVVANVMLALARAQARRVPARGGRDG